MGAALSSTSAPAVPASTATLCVLPLRTQGQSRFSITPGPMPQQLSTRLSEAEYHGFVAGINTVLQPLSGFGFMSLLLPFLLVDVLTMVVLSSIDPWIILSPWEYSVNDLIFPMALEFAIIVCSFPLMSYAVNRRVGEVQRRVREMLDDSSRRYGARGLSFQLKQGVLHNGAGTNMWVELQITPLIHVQAPVPVPVPTLYPILLPSGAQAPSTSAASPTVPEAVPSASHPEPGLSATAAGAGASSAAAAGATLSAQQVEYLRVLQENQLLRQYLAQTQALVQRLMQERGIAAPAPPTAPQPPAGSATAN